MDKLSEFRCFLQVAAMGSFTGAASMLNITPSAASKQLKALEERLGARLLNRTTRHVSLTDVGRAFRDRIEPVLVEMDEAEQAVTQLTAEPRGRLRISAPMDFGRAHLSGPIAQFAAEHSDLEIDVEFADRFVDVVDEGFDVVVRIGTLADSSLVARYLGPCRRVVCAAPSYLAARGEPRHPAELTDHTRISYSYESERSWTLTSEGDPTRVTVPVRHRSNNGELIRNLVLSGEGIALLPTFLVGDDLRAGRLKALLHSCLLEDLPIHAVYPHRKYLSAKVRHFVDFLADVCGSNPPWDAGL
jgi:DNA-binding transcriptional LysR family regulator